MPGVKSAKTFTYKGTRIPKELKHDIREIVVATSVKEIPDGAFDGCEYLHTITLSPQIKSIGKKAFKRCVSLEEIQLPQNLRSIDEGAFAGCILLRKVEMFHCVATIRKFAFRSCYALAYINLSATLEFIGDGVFGDCRSLRSLYIPPSLKRVDKHAFANCTRLVILSLPKDIDIGNEIVRGCHQLLYPTKFDIVYKSNSTTDHEVKRYLQNCLGPLHKLCYRPDITADSLEECVKAQERRMGSKDCLTEKNDHGMTAFHILVANPNVSPDVIKCYLKLSPGIAIVPDYRGWYPIHFAAIHYMSANDEVIDRLATAHTEAGEVAAILSTEDCNGTPTEFAIKYNSSEDVQVRLYSFNVMTKSQCTNKKEIAQLEYIEGKYVTMMTEKLAAEDGSSIDLGTLDYQGLVGHIDNLEKPLLPRWVRFFENDNLCKIDVLKQISQLKDWRGRRFFDIAPEEIRKVATDRVAFLGRYWIPDEHPIYASNTSVIVRAIDAKAEDYYREIFHKHAGRYKELNRMNFNNAVIDLLQRDCGEKILQGYFDRFDVSRDNLIQENEFIVLCKELLDQGQERAIKFMRYRDQFEKEKFFREELVKKGVNCVMHTFEYYEASKTGQESNRYQKKVQNAGMTSVKDMVNYRHSLVMPIGDKNLDTVFRTENPNPATVRGIAQDIAEGIQTLHKFKICHGDLAARNCLRVQGRYILTDMDASAYIKVGNLNAKRKSKYYVGLKFSSGVLPPELIHRLSYDELEKYDEYFSKEKMNPNYWAKIKPTRGDNDDDDEEEAYVVKTFATEIQPIGGKMRRLIRGDKFDLPYKPSRASEAIDLWSFGVLLYMLCTGETLFDVDRNDDLKTADAFRSLYEWNDEERNDKLCNVKDFFARDLLTKLLSKDAINRGTVSEVLQHAYFTCRPDDVNYNIRLAKVQKRVEDGMRAVRKELVAKISNSSCSLMRAVFDAPEVRTPTCFIIRSTKLPRGNNEHEVVMYAKRSEIRLKEANKVMIDAISWLSWMKDSNDCLSSLEKTSNMFIDRMISRTKRKATNSNTCYLYLIDEYTGRPVNGPGYPIIIKATTTELKKYVPVMMVGWRSITLLNSASSLFNMFLPGFPKIPDEALNDFKTFLNEVKGKEKTLVQNAASRRWREQPTSIHGSNKKKSDGGQDLRDFEQMLLEHDVKQKFCGLMRVHDNDGNAIWVSEKSSNVKIEEEQKQHQIRIEESISIPEKKTVLQMQLEELRIPTKEDFLPIKEEGLTKNSNEELRKTSQEGLTKEDFLPTTEDGLRKSTQERFKKEELRYTPQVEHRKSTQEELRYTPQVELRYTPQVELRKSTQEELRKTNLLTNQEASVDESNIDHIPAVIGVAKGEELTEEVVQMRQDMRDAMQQIVLLQQQFNDMNSKPKIKDKVVELFCGESALSPRYRTDGLHNKTNSSRYSKNYPSTQSDFRRHSKYHSSEQSDFAKYSSTGFKVSHGARYEKYAPGTTLIHKKKTKKRPKPIKEKKKNNKQNYISAGFELMPQGNDGNVVVMERRMWSDHEQRDDFV